MSLLRELVPRVVELAPRRLLARSDDLLEVVTQPRDVVGTVLEGGAEHARDDVFTTHAAASEEGCVNRGCIANGDRFGGAHHRGERFDRLATRRLPFAQFGER